MMTLGPNDNRKMQFKNNDLVCYCFEYTMRNIETDYIENGFSTILEKIKKEKNSHGCDCNVKNPKGK